MCVFARDFKVFGSKPAFVQSEHVGKEISHTSNYKLQQVVETSPLSGSTSSRARLKTPT